MFDKIDRNKLLLYASDKDKLVEDVKLRKTILMRLLIIVGGVSFATLLFLLDEINSEGDFNESLNLFVIVQTIAFLLLLVAMVYRIFKIKKMYNNCEIKILEIKHVRVRLSKLGKATSNRHDVYGETYDLNSGNFEKSVSFITTPTSKHQQIVGKVADFTSKLVIDEKLLKVSNYIVVLEYKNKFYFLPNKLWEKPFNA